MSSQFVAQGEMGRALKADLGPSPERLLHAVLYANLEFCAVVSAERTCARVIQGLQGGFRVASGSK